MSNEQIRAIEENIKEAKKIADFGTVLERLQANRDFKQVIIDGYFKEEAIRLVHLKAEPSCQTPDIQRSIIAQMDSIGNLSKYFQTVYFKADQARKAIGIDEETHAELLAEGDE